MMDKHRFTVLEGGRERPLAVNGVSLSVTPESRSPLYVEVRVFEEDTFLVLTVDPVMRYTEEHPVRVMTRLMETKPNQPGSIVTRNNSWYAVVHDLDAEPACRPEWTEQAYRTILRLAENKRVRRIGMPLLGSVHGKITHDESLDLLLNTLNSLSFQHLKKILILAPETSITQITALLRSIAAR